MIRHLCFCMTLLVTAQTAHAGVEFTVGDYPHQAGYDATFLHSASSGSENDASMNGSLSSDLSGTLMGDVVNTDILKNISGSINGTAGNLASYLGNGITPATPITIQLGISAGGNGALDFSVASTEKIGGWIDYSITAIGTSGTFTDIGTFFFFPKQLVSGSVTLPNDGSLDDDKDFALWGNNWQYTNPDWSFLTALENATSLTAANKTSVRPSDNNSGVDFGIDIYAVWQSSIDTDTTPTPEPTTVIVWSLLSVVGFVAYRKYNGNKSLTAIDAYCPDCGGQTLVQSSPSEKISCPQCSSVGL